MMTNDPTPHYPSPEVCPICKEGRQFVFIENYENDRTWSLYECDACHVQFWLPLILPSGEDYNEDVAYQGKSQVLYKKNAKTIVNGAWNMHQFLKNAREGSGTGKTLLDIGCGTGEFMFAAQMLGYEVEGIDFNKSAIALGKERFDLEKIWVADAYDFLKNKKDSYDVIAAFEVIEHVNDPARFLQLAKGALKSGGVLAVSTPNRNRYGGKINAADTWDFPDQHLLRWSAPVLRTFIEKQGFVDGTITKQLPVEWFIARFRNFLGAVVKKGVDDDRCSASEATRSRVGFARYHRVKNAIIFVFSLPAFIMANVFGFEGLDLYAVFNKPRGAQ